MVDPPPPVDGLVLGAGDEFVEPLGPLLEVLEDCVEFDDELLEDAEVLLALGFATGLVDEPVLVIATILGFFAASALLIVVVEPSGFTNVTLSF